MPVRAAGPRVKTAAPKPRRMRLPQQRAMVQRGFNAPRDQAFRPGAAPPTRVIGSTVVRVAKSELFQTFSSDANGEFSACWSLNPANDALFPWISTMSPMFSFFNIVSLKINYYHVCNVLMPGSLVMGYLYDAEDDPSLLDYQGVSQLQGSVMVQAANNVSVPINKSRFMQRSYAILDGGEYVPSRLTVPAWFVVAGTGLTPSSSLGNLEVAYDIELIGAQRVERALSRHYATIYGTQTLEADGQRLLGPGFDLHITPPNVPNWMQYDQASGRVTIDPQVTSMIITFAGYFDTAAVWEYFAHSSVPTSWFPQGGTGFIRASNEMTHFTRAANAAYAIGGHAYINASCYCHKNGHPTEPWEFTLLVDTHAVGISIPFSGTYSFVEAIGQDQ